MRTHVWQSVRSETVRMTRSLTLTGLAACLPRRPQLTLTAMVLAAFVLGACGTEQPQATSRSTSADVVGSEPSAVPPSPDQQTAFIEMLNSVGQPCYPDAPTDQESSSSEEAPDAAPPTAPTEMLPIDKTPPSSAPSTPDPSATPREVVLGALERCEGRLHIERISNALSGMTDSSPAQVRKALNRLGYIDERIHDLEQSGPTTHFFLDLRFMGGSLCLDGSVTGTKVVVEAFGAPEVGPFTPVNRKR